MELNHPGLLSLGMIEAVMKSKLTRFPAIGDAQYSHELMCNYVNHFLKMNLNQNAESMEFITNTPGQNGVRNGVLVVEQVVSNQH